MWWPTHARVALGDAERALELGAARRAAARAGHRQRERVGHEPARAPQQQRPPARDRAQHGVVRARVDRAVVEEHEVGDPGQPLERVGVLVRDRLVGDVAARHHERLAGVGEQQVVQRRVRQQHAEVGRCAARPTAATAASGRPRREHDRAVAPGSSAASSSVSATSARAASTSRTITANGLSSRCLRARSAATAGSSRRQAREVVAADALDRDDRAVAAARRPPRAAPRRRRGRPAAAAASARTRGTRWAGRGSAGRPGPRTRRRSAGTCSKPAIVVSGRS